jgi:hypothetical protein
MSYTPTRGPLKGMTYRNEYRYRKALALHEGYRSRNEKRRTPNPIPRLRDTARLSTREQRARERALVLQRHFRLPLLTAQVRSRPPGSR